jgi:hypothetical protein
VERVLKERVFVAEAIQAPCVGAVLSKERNWAPVIRRRAAIEQIVAEGLMT